MDSSATSMSPKFSGTTEYADRSLGNDRAELTEAPRSANHAARGAITGILLGVVLWAGILALVGVIKF
jgi:hypothetical protein